MLIKNHFYRSAVLKNPFYLQERTLRVVVEVVRFSKIPFTCKNESNICGPPLFGFISFGYQRNTESSKGRGANDWANSCSEHLSRFTRHFRKTLGAILLLRLEQLGRI